MASAKLVVKEGHNRGAILPLDRDPVRLGRDEDCEIRLLDAEASRDHARITGIGKAPVLEDRNSRNGVFVNGVRCRTKALHHGDEVRIGKSVFLFLSGSEGEGPRSSWPGPGDETVTSPARRGAEFQPRSDAAPAGGGSPTGTAWTGPVREMLVGASAGIREVSALIHKVAPTGMPVLVTGESGTGKELVARAVHRNSPRRNGPFVPVNVAALPEALVESELFGHEKGAFTGALACRAGRFEEAHGGTLFLDEIGETPPSIQAKLLRALEGGEIRRLGSGALLAVDARLIAATNRDVNTAVREGRLREDLVYRLKGFEIALLPLRDRKADIPELARYFLDRFRTRFSSRAEGFSSTVLKCFQAYAWPGNVRELKNVIERALILSEGMEILLEDLPPEVREMDRGGKGERTLTLQQLERRQIVKALRLAGGNKSRAADRLGIHRKTLYSKMKVHGIRSD